ncbi:MAG: alpha-hydroxy acid oxidase [Vicinamibacterales bacterium]
MSRPMSPLASRRRLLQMLAASPALPFAAMSAGWVERLLASGLSPMRLLDDEVIASAKDALDVMDFEAVARKNLPPAHFGYMATGTDDDGTIRANREAFNRYQLRVRRLVDFSRLDMSVELLGRRWESPIVLCPVGSQKAFHADGEIATARAANAKKHLQILSTVSSTRVEDVCAARGEPVWWQLYAQDEWSDTRQMIKRAEAAGCPALVFTVDLLGGSNRETLQRATRADSRQCNTCHTPDKRKPIFEGLTSSATVTGVNPIRGVANAPPPKPPSNTEPSVFTWDFVKRLRDATSMKVLVKGIVTREDAEAAIEHGVSGVVVSNHGGRAENSGRGTLESLPDVVAGAAGRIPVIVDGGFRRGTDIFKALALGATAVGIGRPYVWGLAGFGQEGVEAVLEILRRELQMVMRQAGTTSTRGITKDYLVDRFPRM